MQKYALVAFREGEPDHQCALTEDGCTIGRTAEADLVLPDSTISRKHATVRIADGQVVIEDHGSTNGVFVNREQVTRSSVREGDFITLGAYTLVVRAMDEPEADALPKGETFCIGFDTAKRLHEESLENRCPRLFPVFYRTALLLGRRGDLETSLRQVLTWVVEALHAQRGAIVLQHSQSENPQVAAHISLNGGSGEPPLSRTLLDYVLQSNTALLTEDAQTDPRFSASGTVIRHHVGAAMCAPLCGTSRTVGVFYIDSPTKEPTFSREELEFLTVIGHVVGMTVENKHLDEHIVRQEKLAALGQAVAGISHDVRNVLTGMKVGVGLLEQMGEAPDPEPVAQACRLLKRSAGQVESYLTDLLSFVRKDEIHPTPTDVGRLVHSVLDIARLQAKESGVDLEFQKAVTEPATLDGPLMHRVLLNVVTNAIEACGTDGGTVTISAMADPNGLNIRISDTGIGIAENDIPRLWEPFYSTKGSSGTGLGLAISHRIVEQHGGRITVTSHPGKGSEFLVAIPSCATPGGPLPGAPTAAGSAFQTCANCGVTWPSRDNFMTDPMLTISGYQANFDELIAGEFLFGHVCGHVLRVPAGDFWHLCESPVRVRRLTGTAECPGYCLKCEDLSACPEDCECAHLRSVLKVIQDWPKR
jgi:signal transduction histidine kinase